MTLRPAFLTLLLAPLLSAQSNPEWTTPQPPFHIAGPFYYVGSRDLAVFLVVTKAGNILINANLETSPPQIREAVEKLGFQWRDTKILLNSQAHFDHAAGTAAIAKETRAKVMAMEGDADVIESGGKTDFAHLTPFPPAHVDRVLHDGEILELGGVALKALKTAGHTRGCTTFTAKVADAAVSRLVVIVGGLTVLDNYKLTGPKESYPGIAADFERTFKTLDALPVDIFLGAHGSYFGMLEKLGKRSGPDDASVWVDREGYHRAIQTARASFERKRQAEGH